MITPATLLSSDSMNVAPHVVELFVDGACSGNPGPGGWGALLRASAPHSFEEEFYGNEAQTTNNRMELMAAIKGIEKIEGLGLAPVRILIYTDSLYLRDGMTKWMAKWKQDQWSDALRRGIKNLDLWQCLDRLSQKYSIEWHWVRGHSGHAENERVDFLARNAIVQHLMTS